MPLDSREKRASALGVACATFALVLPVADGTVSQADRQQTTFAYAGILAGPPVPVVLLDICSTTVVSLNPERIVDTLNPERTVDSLVPSRTVERFCS